MKKYMPSTSYPLDLQLLNSFNILLTSQSQTPEIGDFFLKKNLNLNHELVFYICLPENLVAFWF